MREGPRRADGVNPADESSQPFERLAVLELGRPAAAAGKDREAKALEAGEGLAVENERRHDGNLVAVELRGEGVLLEDLRVGPARRTVELGHDLRAVLHAHLIDAVLVAVQRIEPAVAAQAQALERVQHHVGRKARVRVGIVHRGVRIRTLQALAVSEMLMKNPLDSLWGTVICGFLLTVVLYYLARMMMGG